MSRPNFIVSPEWVCQHLSNPEVVIVDCRFSLGEPHLGQQQYQESHIPGAHYLDLNQDMAGPVQRHGGRHPLPEPHRLLHKLAQLGISDRTLVVGYDDSRFAFAARLWWLLRYLGHDRVAVLDGGFAAYQAAGYPVTRAIPTPQPGRLTLTLHPEQVVDIETVQARKDLPQVVLVDSRTCDRYLGNQEPIDPIAGHIPGAVNSFWQENTNEQGYLRPSPELRSHWRQLETAAEVIVYCGSGITACVNLLALAATGIHTGKLYAGSWSDWCSYPLDEKFEAQINCPNDVNVSESPLAERSRSHSVSE